MTVGERIREVREQSNMSQIELAEKMGYKDKSSISKIESSGNKVTLKTIEKAAKALNVSPSYFMEWENEHSISEKGESIHESDIYKRYRQLRNLYGLRDADVARMTRITPSTFTDWKYGNSMPNTLKMVAIARVLTTSVEYLITGEVMDTNDAPPPHSEILDLWSRLSSDQRDNVTALINSFIAQNKKAKKK